MTALRATVRFWRGAEEIPARSRPDRSHRRQDCGSFANARLDPTLLLADVEIVATYEQYNVNRVKF
jgi:hypothetical protein